MPLAHPVPCTLPTCTTLKRLSCINEPTAGALEHDAPPTHPTPAGMLTPDGRCKTMDAAADGYVRAEAAGVLLLHPMGSLSAPISTPLAIIRGSAVNQDGRSSSLTAPNGPAQQAVLRAALQAAGAAAGEVGHLSMHGTGGSSAQPPAWLRTAMNRRSGMDTCHSMSSELQMSAQYCVALCCIGIHHLTW
jgi:hypothetical protein